MDLLSKANAPRVLAVLRRAGEATRYTDIRNAAGLGDAQISRALKDLNQRGLVASIPGEDRSMHYALTPAGQEAVALLADVHRLVHGKAGGFAEATDKELEAILA